MDRHTEASFSLEGVALFPIVLIRGQASQPGSFG
jgi:hypothetical protein